MALSRSRGADWLRDELPALLASGVINDEAARALERHYASETRSRGLGLVVLAAVGSALIAAGIILLVAHNWDEFSRPFIARSSLK